MLIPCGHRQGTNGANSAFAMFAAASLGKWITSKGRRAKANRVRSGYLFSPVPAVEVLWTLCFGMAVAFVYYGFRSPSDHTVVLIGLVFMVFTAVTWPENIWFLESAARQRFWYGR